jgi:hypothetical protein
VDTALATVKAEREKAALLRDTYLPKIKQARETIDFAYRRGGVNLLDYLDAQRTYREKSLEYLRSLANYRTAVYVLEAAGGRPIGELAMRPLVSLLLAFLLALVVSGCRDSPSAQIAPTTAPPGASTSPVTVCSPPHASGRPSWRPRARSSSTKTSSCASTPPSRAG